MQVGPENTLGVDVGGTRIRAARIGPGCEILARIVEPVRPGREGFSRQILRLIGGLRNADTRAVGIGIPGRVDGQGQKILSAGYLDIAGLDLCALMVQAGLPLGTRAADLLAAGDAQAEALLAQWAAPLRRAVETLVSVADPKLVVIGGGLGTEMVAALARLPARESWFGLPVAPARLGDDAGVIGAGLAAFSAPQTCLRSA